MRCVSVSCSQPDPCAAPLARTCENGIRANEPSAHALLNDLPLLHYGMKVEGDSTGLLAQLDFDGEGSSSRVLSIPTLAGALVTMEGFVIDRLSRKLFDIAFNLVRPVCSPRERQRRLGSFLRQ